MKKKKLTRSEIASLAGRASVKKRKFCPMCGADLPKK